MIVCVSKNNVIGNNNKLIFNIKDDLKQFKAKTLNKYIIMGRKTFESLPNVLPNRKHIILTKNKNYRVDNPNVYIVHELNEIFDLIQNEEAFVIGGGEIYKLMLPYTKTLYLSYVDKYAKGDTYFPELNNWIKVDSEKYDDFIVYILQQQ